MRDTADNCLQLPPGTMGEVTHPHVALWAKAHTIHDTQDKDTPHMAPWARTHTTHGTMGKDTHHTWHHRQAYTPHTCTCLDHRHIGKMRLRNKSRKSRKTRTKCLPTQPFHIVLRASQEDIVFLYSTLLTPHPKHTADTPSQTHLGPYSMQLKTHADFETSRCVRRIPIPDLLIISQLSS